MRFDDLLALIRGLDLDDGPDPARRPPRDHVRRVQDAMSASLAEPAFYLDCLELELDAVTRRPPIGQPRSPMFRMRDRPLVFQMFYWWPGRIATPHEHTRWTVTAVFFNRLQVTTYDLGVAIRDRRLARKNVFVAEQGRAGHIYERCIHNPSNLTNRDSMSLHIFNESDVPLLEKEVGPIPGLGLAAPALPDDPALRARVVARRTQDQLRVLARAAAQVRGDRARSLLAEIAARGDAETQARIDRLCWHAARSEPPAPS